MLTCEFLCEHTVPKAGALALLQRTAARTQTEKRAIRQQSRQGEEERRQSTEEEAVGAKLVTKSYSVGVCSMSFFYIKESGPPNYKSSFPFKEVDESTDLMSAWQTTANSTLT